jgi:pyrimidine oxygenase
LNRRNIVFMGTSVIQGSYQSCARQIDELARDTGVDGLLLSFLDFVGGIRSFGEKIIPMLA